MTITLRSVKGSELTHGELDGNFTHLRDSQWRDVREFGALGNNVDDTTALQAALDSLLPLYFPPGTYRITAPLTYDDTVRMKGAGGKEQGGSFSRIIGNFANPLIHREGVLVDHNDAIVDATNIDAGTGPSFIAEDMLFKSEHIDGTCIQIYNNSAPIHFQRCGFEFDFRGLIMLQTFDALVTNCYFTGNHFGARTIADNVWQRAYGLYGGHMMAIGCGFKGCGTAIYSLGSESNHVGHRIETCGYGLLIGGPTLAPSVLGADTPLTRSIITGVSMESNFRHIYLNRAGNGLELSNIGIQGGTNGPLNGGDGKGDYGVWIASGSHTTKVKNISIGGYFKTTAVYFDTEAYTTIEGITPEQLEADRPTVGGGARLVSATASGLDYAISRVPLNPSVAGSITAWSGLHLRGLKGLNLRDKAQPSNLGGIVSVATSATTHAVAFAAAVGTGDVSYGTVPTAVVDGASTLAPATYWYAVTRHSPRGETGIDSLTAISNNYRSVVVAAGRRVDLTINGGIPPAGSVNRIYRGTALGSFSGYFEVAADSFSDSGQAFTGRDMPSRFTGVPAATEPDANYAIVATASWPCMIQVTAKATTGFTLSFWRGDGTVTAPAPAGGTVQWLLFRP